MKQIVILSGKGGTGKTSLAAAFSHLATEGPERHSAVLADADVDAANLELVVAPKILEREDFQGAQVASINQKACVACGDCLDVCRFEAIYQESGTYHVDPVACEGCAACAFYCPDGAITMQDQVAGQWFRSMSRYGPRNRMSRHISCIWRRFGFDRYRTVGNGHTRFGKNYSNHPSL